MKSKTTRIIDAMMKKDLFSKCASVSRGVKEGYCGSDGPAAGNGNGFEIAHGGITYSFADSAFAFGLEQYGQATASP